MHSARRHGAIIAAVVVPLVASGCAQSGPASKASDLCDDPTTSATVDNPASRPIAFTSDRAGNYDIWLMGADGSDAVQLTTTPDDEAMPSWSPDGAQLTFMSGDFERTGDICTINTDGTGLQNITDTVNVVESAPSWSPSRDEIAYTKWQEDDGQVTAQVHVMGSDGEESRMVATDGDWPSWSPDGEQMVLSARNGTSAQALWTVNRDGSSQTLLAGGTEDLTEPAWSADGKAVAFVSASGDPEAADPAEWNEDIFVMSTEGGPARQITTHSGNDHWPAAWSPETNQLAFTADGKDNVGEIFVVDLSTLETSNLTDHSAHDMFPAWRR
jgi:Tol biopolymer transport system component